jgi:hypothetical protein
MTVPEALLRVVTVRRFKVFFFVVCFFFALCYLAFRDELGQPRALCSRLRRLACVLRAVTIRDNLAFEVNDDGR